MHRNYLLLLNLFMFLFSLCSFGCVSKPPLAEIITDSEDVRIVGTPGAIAFPEKKDMDTGEDEAAPVADASASGCTYDSQCKGDRVCIAGACVSPEYAADYEAKVMASAGVGNGTGVEKPVIIGVLVPPAIKRKLGCSRKHIDRCMKKCDDGNLASCFAVGRIFENHPEDSHAEKYGVYAYRRACDGGDALACILLSRMFFVGAIVEQNYGVSFSLNVDGCVLKDPFACYNAAVFLENGIGVDKNPDMASEYYTQACIYGHDDSCPMAKPTDTP